MRTKLLALACVVLLQACGTYEYKPTEYPLRAGLIPPFTVAGDVKVTNGQSAADPVTVYSYMGSNLSSNLKAITETMVQQTTKEIAKNGRPTGGKPKTIELKVNSLLSEYVVMYWKSKIEFQAKLGNGRTVTKLVPHGSGNVSQDLNGCIAEGVMVLLRDDQVRTYLEK